MDCRKKLIRASKNNNSLLCIGLDVDKSKMPPFLFDTSTSPYFDFNKAIIDATKDMVCAYKLNLAFYELMGTPGYDLLEKTIEYIPNNIVVILDGKRNDIGNSARKYAQALFDSLRADAVTINPYLGADGVMPFIEYTDKCVFILCRTSNISAGDFQDLQISGKPLYYHVAVKINQWNSNGNCGVVVGATYPDELRVIRKLLGDSVPFLIPGIGAQGGDVEKTIKYGTNSTGDLAIINSSRGIIYAGKNQDFTDLSKKKAKKLRDEINLYRDKSAKTL
jgi:orotidine-5'-phosphate decarboxylase